MALLRLTNFNFYLSQLFGFETEINATGGNAFNFINYFCAGFAILVLVAKSPAIRTNWKSLWPIFGLMLIYSISFLFSPFTLTSWFVYQLIFLLIAAILHIFSRKVSIYHGVKLKRGLHILFWVSIIFVLYATFKIISSVGLTYYLVEFNDAFVNSLDEIGIMKQRYGYFLGFLLSYAIFFLRRGWWQLAVVGILFFAGFGIRSFILGAIAALLAFSLYKPKYLFALLAIGVFLFSSVLWPYFDNLIYDTRFYSYVNALYIIQQFPFGLGLGGYPIYTELFGGSILAEIYNVSAVLDYIPTAPESDFVHIFGSLGLVLGSVHVFIQMRIIWLSVRFQKFLVPFEKCILFYYCFMTFFGLSEDSMFSVNYWIFFGISSGIISSVLLRKNNSAS